MQNKDYINKILHGDCLDWMQQIEDKSVDMILCDLPYGTTACKWDSIIPFEPLWEQYERVIKDNGAIVLTASQPFTTKLVDSNLKMFKYELIWDKVATSSGFHAKRMPLKKHENILVFYKKPPVYNPQMVDEKQFKRGGAKRQAGFTGESQLVGKNLNYDGLKYPKSILTISNADRNKVVHPTQKPVALCEYLIKTYSNENEIVLDNCIGSGTTAVACVNTNRNFIGIEKEWDYCEIANKRITRAKEEVSVNA